MGEVFIAAVAAVVYLKVVLMLFLKNALKYIFMALGQQPLIYHLLFLPEV